MKAAIIEDEYHSALALKKMLEEYCPGITNIEVYDSVGRGLTGMIHTKPDIIFLDVMLKDQTGFDLLELLPQPHPQVIFTTAHAQHAIRAIRSAATDYLLKPISIKELQFSVACAQKNLHRYSVQELNEQVKSAAAKAGIIHRIAIPTNEGHVFINTADIIRFEASGSYTQVIINNQPALLVSRQLKEYELMLGESGFVRVHHSHVVNTVHIKKYVRGNGGYLLMSDGKNVDVSQSKKENLLKILGV